MSRDDFNHWSHPMPVAVSECCASGSCEVCRMPQGYSPEQREQIKREAETYDPPWVRQHQREGWTR